MAQIQVTVVEGRNLKKKDLFSDNDAFVQVYLDDQNQKQKTKVKQNSKNPLWNQNFVFNHFQGQDTLHVEVYDEDTIRNDKIGSLTIDLRDLYEKRRIDSWYHISSKFHTASQGEIHLKLEYQPLKV